MSRCDSKGLNHQDLEKCWSQSTSRVLTLQAESVSTMIIDVGVGDSMFGYASDETNKFDDNPSGRT